MSNFTKDKWKVSTNGTLLDDNKTIGEVYGISRLHTFNLLDARGVISKDERTNYINDIENFMPHFPNPLSLFAKNGNELLARIDNTEAENE